MHTVVANFEQQQPRARTRILAVREAAREMQGKCEKCKADKRTEVVGADLVGLLTAHQQADLTGLLVLQDFCLAHTTLSPLIATLVEAIQLGATA